MSESVLKNTEKTHPPVSPFFKGDLKTSTDKPLMKMAGGGDFPPLYKRGPGGFLQHASEQRHYFAINKPAGFFTTVIPVLFLLFILTAGSLRAEDATVPGVLTTPWPTITNLAVQWEITGDDNLNCTARIWYREAGSSAWREGMPLRRIPADRSIGTQQVFSWRNKLSGSVFGLRPGTEYELRVQLFDPDGGAEERFVTVSTRSVPRAPADSVVRHADPSTFQAVAQAAVPGDVIILAPGNYGIGQAYVNGTADKPIVIRGSRADTAAAVFNSFSLRHIRHVILDNLTVNGRVDVGNTDGISVRHSRINAPFGIVADNPTRPARNAYIADNLVTWTVPWTEDGLGSEGTNEGEGIQLTGPGNVICFNRVTGYRDCISLMEDSDVSEQYCIDIYNNDIYNGLDDAIEADFCQGNCRIMHNRITNSFMGLSSQPGLGGPTYFIRNVMYNIIDCPFKLARYSKGDVILHNTVVKVGSGLRVVHNPSYAYFRNNLTLGGRGGRNFGVHGYGSGDGRAIEFDNADSTTSMDYDAIGSHEYHQGFLAKIGTLRAWSIEELNASFWEKNAVRIGIDVFARTPDWPDPPFPGRAPADLRPAAGSAVIARAQRIPNVNDDFTGAGPDIGAYEFGRPLPHYGPRPVGVDEETSLSGRTCDFTGDGRSGVADVLAMLLIARRDPSDPRLDLDGDGKFTFEDSRILLADILSGQCAGRATALAASDGTAAGLKLSAAEVEYLEETVRLLGLGVEETDLLLDAIRGGSQPAQLPRTFALAQNYPNPFNPSTTIRILVPEGSRERVSLKVFDLRGRLVRVLLDEQRDAGSYTLFWDGTDMSGLQVSSGVYFYRLLAGDFSQTRKMVLLK